MYANNVHVRFVRRLINQVILMLGKCYSIASKIVHQAHNSLQLLSELYKNTKKINLVTWFYKDSLFQFCLLNIFSQSMQINNTKLV